MSHFNACVFMKDDGSSDGEMERRVEELMGNFILDKKVAPYKHYIKAEQIEQMAKHYKIDVGNLPALAEKLEDWEGDKGGVDEGGFYGISTRNPDGHIDYCSVVSEIKPEERERLLIDRGGEGRVARVVVTPDGRWLSGPWIYGRPSAEQQKELAAWDEKLAALIEEHKNDVAILVDCHV